MKTKNMEPGPETFLQGVGQYSYEAMMGSLGWLGMDTEQMLATLSGLGQALTQPGGLMTAIVNNATEMDAKMRALASARKQAAKKSPMAAAALAQAQKKTSAPGTNVAKGVVQTMNAAAKKAAKAKRDEQQAKTLIKQNDKRAAAAKAVDALTAAREAATLANRAEKTRLATSLDTVANTLEAQARYLDGIVAREAGMTGQSVRTTALAATALNLRQEAKKLRNRSALVAAQPDVPPQAPTPQRIADLANRFNIRTAGRERFMQNKALVSVLGDLSDDPMAQAPDYNGALAYYGNDDVGRLMADIEFDNRAGAVDGLSRAVNGLGYTDTLPAYAMASSALAQGQALAQQAYKSAVLPAAGLGGLGALGSSDDAWCDKAADVWANVTGNKSEAETYRGKCKAILPIFAPWDKLASVPAGLPLHFSTNPEITRGGVGAAIRNLIPDAAKAVSEGSNLVGQVTGGKPAQLPSAVIPSAQLPPEVAAQTLPSSRGGKTTPAGSYSFSTAAKGLPTYVYAIGGVAVLGAAYLFMMPKRA